MSNTPSSQASAWRATSPRAGFIVAVVVFMASTAPLAALLLHGEGISLSGLQDDRHLWRVTRFSLLQAGLSTLLSVVPGFFVARAFYRQPRFPGRTLLLHLFGLPLVVPAIVAVLAVIGVFGADGWLPMGRNLYGLTGILIAHVFFNLPLAVRLLLPSFERISPASQRLATQFGFSDLQRLKTLEWPAVRSALAGTTLLVFMLCLTSFAVVLGLGGGPRSTTLEVAIYQALRFDFEPSRAALLALLQLSICAALALGLAVMGRRYRSEAVILSPSQGLIERTTRGKMLDGILITATLLIVAIPLASVLSDGLSGPVTEVLKDKSLWISALWSFVVALCATTLAVTAGWLLLRTTAIETLLGRHRLARTMEMLATMVYVVPPLVLGTGYFLLAIGRVPVDHLTLPLVIMVNTLMGLPFVVRSLQSAIRQRTVEYQLLCQSLAITGFNRIRYIEFPLIRKQLGMAAALVTALSFGDLGVVALFASQEWITLPLRLYHRLAAYQIPEASVTALFLLLTSLALFAVTNRIIAGRQHAQG